MKKVKFALVLVGILYLNTTVAQKYTTKNAKAYFISKASMENIDATNNTATLVLDSKTGVLAVSLSVKGFVFEKGAEYQTKFNSHYLESDKFPNASFKGTISNNTDVKYTTDGTYTANITGKLTIHGVSKDVTTKANITVKAGALTAATSFKIKLADYGISVPASASKNISSTVEIKFSTAKMDILK
jgi:YceI-like domain